MVIFAVEATMTATKTSRHPRTPPAHSRGSAGRREVRVMTAGMTGMTLVGLRSLQLGGESCWGKSSEKVTEYFQLKTSQVFQVF